MTDKPKSNRGRKKVEWVEAQWKAFNSMCYITTSKQRVARAMGNDVKTIDRLVRAQYGMKFSDYIQKRFDEGNMKLLAKQYEVAMTGDRTMLIWLGKNRLNQADKTETKDMTDPILSITVEQARKRLAKLMDSKPKADGPPC